MIILVTLGFIAIFAILYFLTEAIWPDNHKWREPKESQNKKGVSLLNQEFHKDVGHTGDHISAFTFEEYEELNPELQSRLLKEASPKEYEQWYRKYEKEHIEKDRKWLRERPKFLFKAYAFLVPTILFVIYLIGKFFYDLFADK
jgi:hypothetical protein